MMFLVVDDDKAILRGMVRRLQEMELGEPCAILTASSGEEALAILRDEKVDILLTDIRMQQMDGLSLIEAAQAIRPHLHSIVISAYDHFPYAQKALRLGVDDFLLKPCTAAAMRQVVERAVEKHHAEHQARAERLSMRLYNYLTASRTDAEGALKAGLADMLGEPVPPLLRVARWQGNALPCIPKGWHFALSNQPVMLLEGTETGRVQVEAFAGLSDAGGWEMLPELMRQATEALRLAWYWDMPRVISYAAPQALPAALVEQQKDLLSSLGAFAEQSEAKAWHAADAIAAQTQAAPAMGDFLRACDEALRQACRGADISVPPDFSPEAFSGWRNAMFHFLEAYHVCRGQYNRQHREDPIAWAQRYVEEHAREPIDMAEMANRLHMSYAHFSKRFKERAGKSFTEYHMQVRMQWAADAMRKGRRVSEVADILGYQNLQNFSRAFSRFYGMSPKQWQLRREVDGKG